MSGLHDGVTKFRYKRLILACPESREYTCQYCQLCRSDQGSLRFKCMITGEILFDPKVGVGYLCPLEDVKGEDEQ